MNTDPISYQNGRIFVLYNSRRRSAIVYEKSWGFEGSMLFSD